MSVGIVPVRTSAVTNDRVISAPIGSGGMTGVGVAGLSAEMIAWISSRVEVIGTANVSSGIVIVIDSASSRSETASASSMIGPAMTGAGAATATAVEVGCSTRSLDCGMRRSIPPNRQ